MGPASPSAATSVGLGTVAVGEVIIQIQTTTGPLPAMTEVDPIELHGLLPDLTTMEYVERWFTRHRPELTGAVTRIVVHPVVVELVRAAGDELVAEFRRRFGSRTSSG